MPGYTSSRYISQILSKFGIENANTVSTPTDCNVKLVKDEHVSKPTDQVAYQSVECSLLYVAMGTDQTLPSLQVLL